MHERPWHSASGTKQDKYHFWSTCSVGQSIPEKKEGPGGRLPCERCLVALLREFR